MELENPQANTQEGAQINEQEQAQQNKPNSQVLSQSVTRTPAFAMRIGLGYDVHAFAPYRKLILGGVDIPHHHGLDGHSDADVLAHAVADALLGAISRHRPSL